MAAVSVTPYQPPSHAHAAGMLRARGVTCQRVIAVATDSILYLGAGGTAMTAWLHRGKDKILEIRYEPGFPAEPSPGLKVTHTLYPHDPTALDLDEYDGA